MATTIEDISEWFDRGRKQKATHLIVVCDTFDHEDYPVFVGPSDNISNKIAHYSENMQRVMEVYKLSMPKKTQLNEFRCYNI